MIKIKRESEWRDRFRSYKIILDGEVLGLIKNGHMLEFYVAPGKHKLYLKIDWCRSNIIDFENDGGTVMFECGSSLRGWRIILFFLYVTFFRSKYLWLKKKD